MKLGLNRRRGFTLPEITVSVGIMGLIFGFMGFLTFITARNSYNIHQQVMSQSSAAMASQEVTTLMRNAVGYARFDADAVGEGPYTRLKIVQPSTATATTTETVALYVDNNNRREVRYFNRELAANEFTDRIITFNDGSTKSIKSPTPTPNRRWAHVANFQIFWQSEYRVTLETSYRYKGFAFQFSNPQYDPEGLFVTDAISKNHFMDQGVTNYAQSDNPTSSPATL